METKSNLGEPSEYKSFPTFIWEAKASEDEEGVVTHLISVFGVEDLGSDICHPGSFKKTLEERKDQLLVLDMHRRSSTMDVLGVPLDVYEIGRDGLPEAVLRRFPEATGGVKAHTRFLLDTPEGLGAYRRIKAGAVKTFSFAFDALDKDFSTKTDGRKIRNLRTLRVYEYGPTLFPMNPAAMALSAKGSEPEPTEEKRVDVGPTTISIRVRDSGDFQEGSFRVINIGDKGNGIQARIGRLKGKTTTATQAFLFNKEKWTTEKAEAWVKEHGGSKSDAIATLVEPGYVVREAPEGFLIVESEEGGMAYKAEVIASGSGEGLALLSRDLWIPGSYMFETEEQKGPPGQAEEELLQLVEIEMSQIEIETEAGPA